MQGTVVLLPLLGLTWVFGLLSVTRATSFFAWIFTVLNSLQVRPSFNTLVNNFLTMFGCHIGAVYLRFSCLEK